MPRNVSEASVKTFADQPWWAAAARATSAVATTDFGLRRKHDRHDSESEEQHGRLARRVVLSPA